jgi:hypothetical protein
MRAIAAAVIHPAVPPPTITIDRIRSATHFLPKIAVQHRCNMRVIFFLVAHNMSCRKLRIGLSKRNVSATLLAQQGRRAAKALERGGDGCRIGGSVRALKVVLHGVSEFPPPR